VSQNFLEIKIVANSTHCQLFPIPIFSLRKNQLKTSIPILYVIVRIYIEHISLD